MNAIQNQMFVAITRESYHATTIFRTLDRRFTVCFCAQTSVQSLPIGA